MSSEGYLACHTYCYTGHQYTIVISADSDTHTFCRAFSSGSVITCINHIGLSQLRFENPIFRIRGERSNRLRNRRCFMVLDLRVNLYSRSTFKYVPCLTLDNTKNRNGSCLEDIEILKDYSYHPIVMLHKNVINDIKLVMLFRSECFFILQDWALD